MSDYIHPKSGRVYREGDPAHHFAQLAAALRRQCENFVHYYDSQMGSRDYLAQRAIWLGDCDRIARSMADTIAVLDKAHTAIIIDRDLHEYGLGHKDEEWQRKYGPVPAANASAPAEND